MMDRDSASKSAETVSNGSAGQLSPPQPANERKLQCSCRLCSPSHWSHRFLVLVFMLMLNFGSYFVYDNPVALENTIINVMRVDVTQYSLLYSLYAWPNVVLAFLGGLLIDKVLGVRLGAIIFSILVCLGQLIVAIGAFVGLYWLMLLGRLVFGFGGESLTVSLNIYAALWFKGKELNLVFGLLLTIPGIGGALNMDVNNKLYSAFSLVPSQFSRLGLVLMVGFLICLMSVGCAVILMILDKRAERILQRAKLSSGETIRLTDIKNFPLTLWITVLINVLYYSTFFTFNGLALIFFIEKYGFGISKGNLVNSMCFLISAFATPFVGVLVDKTGFNLFWVMFGTLSAISGHVLLGFLGFSQFLPLLAMALRAVAYSTVSCALWPLIAYIVEDNQLGTAYGIAQSAQNAGMAVVAIVCGVIADYKGYLVLEVFFLILLVTALALTILLYSLDMELGNKLNISAWARSEAEKEENEEKEAHSRVPSFKDNSSAELTSSYSMLPRTAFHIRNRLLSKIGNEMPPHVAACRAQLPPYPT